MGLEGSWCKLHVLIAWALQDLEWRMSCLASGHPGKLRALLISELVSEALNSQRDSSVDLSDAQLISWGQESVGWSSVYLAKGSE